MSRRIPRLLISLGVGAIALIPSAAHAATPSQRTAAVTFKPVPANQQVNLTMITYLPDISAGAGDVLTSLLTSFEAIHPNIHVTVESSSAATGAALVAATQQSEAAGTQPDVVQIGLDSLRYFVNALGANNLTRTVGSTEVASEFGGDHPFATAVTHLGRINNIQYAVPWTLSTPVIFYNASLFQAAGLNPADPPKTWTDVMNDAAAIKKATGADGLSTCAAGASSGGVDWCTQSVAFSAGGTVLSSTTKKDPKLTFTNPKTVYAMEVLQQLGSVGALVNLTSAQATSEFGAGKLAMVMTSSAAQASLLSAAGGHFQVLDTGVPAFGTNKTAPTNSGSALGILSKNPVNQRASWELIKYLTSDTAMTDITENIGYAPLRPTLVEDPAYLEDWSHTQTLISANLAQLARIVPWEDYPGANFGQIEVDVENAVTSIVFQGANAKSTMASLQSEAQSLIQ